jgi:hypothetical protein
MTVNTEAAAVSSNGSAVPRRSSRSKSAAGKRKRGDDCGDGEGRKKSNKVYHDNLVNSNTRLKQLENKAAKLQEGQAIIQLAEDQGLKITKVTHRVDKNGVSWPSIALANASKILMLMKKICPDLKLDNYGKTGRGKEGSDESKLRSILTSLGFWIVKETSLTNFEEMRPRGNKWMISVCHALLEKGDYVNGKFDATKVEKITSRWRQTNIKKNPNPFLEDNNKKSVESKVRAQIRVGSWNIFLKTCRTAEEAEDLKKEAREFLENNPDVTVTKEKIERSLKGEGLKSKRQRDGWVDVSIIKHCSAPFMMNN